jgi:subtilisin family serine protease
MMRSQRKFALVLTVLMLLAALFPNLAVAGDNPDGTTGLALNEPATLDGSAKIGKELLSAKGRVEVVVQLKGDPLALNPAASRQRATQLNAAQNQVLANLAKYGVKELARLTNTLNAIVVEVDAAKIPAMSKEVSIKSVRALGDYSLQLSDTVPYIGATEVQKAGFDGTGTRVAVLDSGVDYTHVAFGGPGTTAAYQAAAGTGPGDPKGSTLDGLFPTDKVIGGYDFVGDQWPNGPRTEDPDPIDYQGHGTHVSDIIAGDKGVAPGAKILAVKVCSSVSTSCNGVALLKAVEYSLDPNGDKDLSDKVDVMNLSLGSDYGQVEDDLTEALNNAARAGVVVVAAAGNAADKPYIVSSPSIGSGVISVAQTEVPSAKLYPIQVNSPAAIAGLIKVTTYLEWSKPLEQVPGGTVTGNLQRPAVAANGLAIGCTPADFAGFTPGNIALIDRGTCNVSAKIFNAQNAGATAAIIVNNVPGPPPGFSSGGEVITIPGLVISQADGAKLKANLPVNVTLSASLAIPLVGSTVSTSARGPAISNNRIKPDIAAPGASVSAQVGTGTGTTAFGGTSGATPMVAGSALLIRQERPNLEPGQIKALLMNTAETEVYTFDDNGNKYLAPITRIGGGEVRVNRAFKSGTIVSDLYDETGSLSFGYQLVGNQTVSFTKIIKIQNTTNQNASYTITPTFRYANDAENGAVTFNNPATISVPAWETRNFELKLTIDGNKLRDWNLNAGQAGGNGESISELEYDGYVIVDGGPNNRATLPWQVFPHKAADTTLGNSEQNQTLVGNKVNLTFTNQNGAIDGGVDAFQLLAYSDILPTTPPQPGDNFALIDLRAFGVRDFGGNTIQFAVTTYGRRATPNAPAEFDVLVDTNLDGTADYVVLNAPLGLNFNDGRNVVYVQKLVAGATAKAVFVTDADFNSANAILTVPASELGLKAGQKFGAAVEAYDNYFTGVLTDRAPEANSNGSLNFATYTLGQPRYKVSGTSDPNGLEFSVPKGGSLTVLVSEASDGEGLSNATGLLFLYRDALRDAASKREAELVWLQRAY